MKPSLFIASSSEAVDWAYAAQAELESCAEPTVWKQGVFELSDTAIESLIKQIKHSEYAVFIFSPDDVSRIRGKEFRSARDNVVFELGLAIGALGRERCFVLRPHGSLDFRLPTDLLGVNVAEFDSERSDDNKRAALGPACHEIRQRIRSNTETQTTGTVLPKRSNDLLSFGSGTLAVYFLPRDFLIIGPDLDAERVSEEDWSVAIDAYEYPRTWLGATHYHRSYRDHWVENKAQLRKLKVPEADWKFAGPALRFVISIADGAIELRGGSVVVGHERLQELPVRLVHDEAIAPPNRPDDMQPFVQSAPFRDLLCELENHSQRVIHPDDIVSFRRIRREMRICAEQYLESGSAVERNLQELVESFPSAYSVEAEHFDWIREAAEVLDETVAIIERTSVIG